MIAQLGMYDRTETAAANDRLWDGVRSHLGYGPEKLTRGGNFLDIWQSPDLVLAQTCGMPYRHVLYDRVELVGTPDYGLEGCPPGHYYSVLVAQAAARDISLSTLCQGTFAYNEKLSQSGWAAPMVHLEARGLHPATLLETGAHRDSALAVATERADFAALDALTWKMIQTYDDFAARLQVVGRTIATPTLPFITAKGCDSKAVFAALQAAIREMPDSDRETLNLRGLVRIPTADYLSVENPHFG